MASRLTTPLPLLVPKLRRCASKTPATSSTSNANRSSVFGTSELSETGIYKRISGRKNSARKTSRPWVNANSICAAFSQRKLDAESLSRSAFSRLRSRNIPRDRNSRRYPCSVGRDSDAILQARIETAHRSPISADGDPSQGHATSFAVCSPGRSRISVFSRILSINDRCERRLQFRYTCRINHSQIELVQKQLLGSGHLKEGQDAHSGVLQ